MGFFKGQKYFYDYDVSDQVEYNLKNWLEYGFVELGAYTTMSYSLPTSGYTNLQRVKDDRYGGEGRVYEGVGSSWIWETDFSPVSGSIGQIINASGVRVNGTFYPTATTVGTYAHKISFKEGIVIFNSNIAKNSNVSCEYTIRDIGVYTSDSTQWKKIVENYLDYYNELSNISPSGMAQTLKKNRVILPSVVVEVGNRTNTGLQLGGGEINNFDVRYHIYSEQSFSNKKIADVILNQYQTTLDLYNVNSIKYPYDKDGAVASGAKTYKQLANRNGSYFWTLARIEDSDGGPLNSDTDVYRAEVTHNIQIDRENYNV